MKRIEMKRIVPISLLALVAVVGCEVFGSEDGTDYGSTGGTGAGSGGEQTCHATEVGICVEYLWYHEADFQNAKNVCEGGSGNIYREGHSCPIYNDRIRVGCRHEEAGVGVSVTWAYFNRDVFVVDTPGGVEDACRRNGGTVVR